MLLIRHVYELGVYADRFGIGPGCFAPRAAPSRLKARSLKIWPMKRSCAASAKNEKVRVSSTETMAAKMEWFSISREAFNLEIYAFNALFKIVVLVFNLVPYIACVIMG